MSFVQRNQSRLEPGKYVTALIDVKRRNTLVKFSRGAFKIDIDEDRWQNIDV